MAAGLLDPGGFGRLTTPMLAVLLALAPMQAWGGPPEISDDGASEETDAPEQRGGQPEDPEDTVIAALQRQGDARFRADDFAGARDAYLDALARVPRSDAAFRVSLVVLVVNATTAEFAVLGERAPVREVLDLVQAERTVEGLDAELQSILDDAASRLAPLVRVLPPDLPAVGGDVALADGTLSPHGPDPTLVLIVAGSVTAAAGIAAIGAGAAFKPRAVSQVEDNGVAVDDALSFVNGEIRKGQAWIGVGAGVTAAGLAVLVTGVTLRLRSRRAPKTELTVAGSPGAFVLGVRGRW